MTTETNGMNKLREALELIAAPMRPDGTWNRDREACRRIAEEALREDAAPAQPAEPAAWREHVEHRIRTWKQRTMNKSGDLLSIDDFLGQDSVDDLVDFVCDAWAIPVAVSEAPAPQPLSDEQLRDIFRRTADNLTLRAHWPALKAFARAVLAAAQGEKP